MTAAITIHFRKPELTAGCIDTLLADGWAPVLVWDNSADEGRSLQALVARYAGEPRVQLSELSRTRHPENGAVRGRVACPGKKDFWQKTVGFLFDWHAGTARFV